MSVIRPSIQLGILQPVLERAGFSTGIRSFYLKALEHFATETSHLPDASRIGLSDYDVIANRYSRMGMGEWIFAVPPYCEPSGTLDEEYLAYLREESVPEEVISKALRMRELVPGFLAHCVEDVLRESPCVVGFTTSFSQNVSSLILAKLLKHHDPSLKIVFGGGACDGPMGAGLQRAFPWVDVVVRGEGERVFPKLLTDLLSGSPIQPQPGLCYRQDGQPIAIEQDGGKTVPLDDIPEPNYDEYFQRLHLSPMRADMLPNVVILFESARGCWWGEKMHCTFCGLNGSSMTFRSKSAERTAKQLYSMAKRYRHLDFEAVDNIIDLGYIDAFLPILKSFREEGMDFKIFYETKSNLKKEQVRLMSDAGVLEIQPGIESFSNTILKLIKKGVTALQNIRLLKWASEFHIKVTWNIIYGFPGEPPEDYERMADLIQSLTHLQPPNLSYLAVQRFSPYHRSPGEFGLDVSEPFTFNRFLYHVDARTLNDISYDFKHRYDDERDPVSYTKPVKEAVRTWQEIYKAGGSSLRYRRGPGFLIIQDRRPNLGSNDYHLGESEARIYLACDGGATVETICDELSEGSTATPSRHQVNEFLDNLVEARLLYEEDGRYLSLALPAEKS
jgi:ribosomal peptide maturation radical SAM protein 1